MLFKIFFHDNMYRIYGCLDQFIMTGKEGCAMDKYDKDKVDEYTLALLLLVSHNRKVGYGARAWKGFDWDTMDRLHDKGFITDPKGKARSVGMTEEGYQQAEALFQKFFGNE